MRRPPRGLDRRPGPRDPVVLADADEPRAVERRGVADRAERPPEEPAASRPGYASASPRRSRRLAASRARVGGVDRRRLVGLSDCGQVLAAGRGGEHPRRRCAGGERCAWRTMSRNGTWLIAAATSVSSAAAASALPPPIDEPKVATRDRVDAGQRARERDRRAPVGELARRLEQVGLAGAVAEAAVVEDERGDSGVGEALREWPEPVAAGSGEPMGHDDDGGRLRRTCRAVEPAGAALAGRSELELLAVHVCATAVTAAA